jgi:hypothetical protein
VYEFSAFSLSIFQCMNFSASFALYQFISTSFAVYPSLCRFSLLSNIQLKIDTWMFSALKHSAENWYFNVRVYWTFVCWMAKERAIRIFWKL